MRSLQARLAWSSSAWAHAWALTCVLCLVAAQPAAANPKKETPAEIVAPLAPLPANAKVLRLTFESAETTMDPAKISDIYSRFLTAHVFEGLYTYDHLARPSTFVPLVAEGMPEVSADFKVWTIRIKPGIYFADDPAFNGKRRELVAQDFVYSFQRFADPVNKSPIWGTLEATRILGLAERRKAAVDAKKPFDYDTPMAGLAAVDRYTVRFTLGKPAPRLLETLAQTDLHGAVAREVVERYGDAIGDHPVGTGPYKLRQWRRSSKIVLERNPTYRERSYDAKPAADDAEGQAILAKLKGKRLPIADAVDISVIEEEQPRWLSFLNGTLDGLVSIHAQVPQPFISQALPGGRIAPNLAKRGIQAKAQLAPDVTLMLFNMDDPVVGGYTPDKVALRRAINLAVDTESEIRLIRRGQGMPAQSPLVPHTTGYDPTFKSELGEFNPAKAKALLDMYGYVDRDGDGWRELPNGSPLVLVRSNQPEQIYRQYGEQFAKDLARVGLRVTFDIGQWAEHLKQARAGKLQMWMLGSTAQSPDGQTALQRMHGPQSGGQNLSNFKLPEFDAIYDRMSELPNGPERDALFRRASMIAAAYVPYKYSTHRIRTDIWHPWLVGYKRPLFWLDWWHMVDVDVDLRKKAGVP
jgi:ABC-type transport system substrate-binding protein